MRLCQGEMPSIENGVRIVCQACNFQFFSFVKSDEVAGQTVSLNIKLDYHKFLSLLFYKKITLQFAKIGVAWCLYIQYVVSVELYVETVFSFHFHFIYSHHCRYQIKLTNNNKNR